MSGSSDISLLIGWCAPGRHSLKTCEVDARAGFAAGESAIEWHVFIGAAFYGSEAETREP